MREASNTYNILVAFLIFLTLCEDITQGISHVLFSRVLFLTFPHDINFEMSSLYVLGSDFRCV